MLRVRNRTPHAASLSERTHPGASTVRGLGMIFRPHYGKLATGYAGPEPRADVAPPSVSVVEVAHAALDVFARRPAPALGLSLLLMAAVALGLVPYPLLELLSFSEESYWHALLSAAGIHVGLRAAQFTASVAVVLLVSSPLLLGLMAAAIRSARPGATTAEGLGSGFRRLPSTLLLTCLWLPTAAALAHDRPWVGGALSIALWAALWVPFCALADRRQGAVDALRFGFVLVRTHGWPLLGAWVVSGLLAALGCGSGATAMVLGLSVGDAMLRATSRYSLWPGTLFHAAAGTISAVGCVACCVCLVVSIALAVLLLAVAYRHAVDALQPTRNRW